MRPLSPIFIRRLLVASVVLAGGAPRLCAQAGIEVAVAGLPAGNFTLNAWLDEKTTLELPVTLKAGQTLHVEIPRAKQATSH